MADSASRPAKRNPKIPKEAQMPDIEDVLEDAQREIKSIGDNVKTLKDNMEKNLADVRKIAEDAPKAFAASEQFKKDMEALTAGGLEKHDATRSPAFLRHGSGGLDGGRPHWRGLARVRRRFPGEWYDHLRQHDRAAISRSFAGRLCIFHRPSAQRARGRRQAGRDRNLHHDLCRQERDDHPVRAAGATDIAAPAFGVLNTTSNVGRIGFNGSTISGPNFVLAASFNINNNYRAQKSLGVLGAVGVGNGQFTVTGQLQTDFGDATIYNQILNNTLVSLRDAPRPQGW
jgi:hypothetical protein